MNKHTRLRIIFLILLLVVGILGFQYWRGHISISSLKTELLELTKQEVVFEICENEYALYPGPDQPFPLFSPDGRYYADIDDSRFRRAEVLKLYLADTNQIAGMYSYFRLAIYCWAPDSSGIYVADYVPGSSGFFSFYDTPGRTGPVKKLLVP